MLELLKRDPSPDSGNKNDQAHAYTALALPPGAKLWSKAGWTSECRHDAAYVELPNGAKFVLVIFTMDHASRARDHSRRGQSRGPGVQRSEIGLNNPGQPQMDTDQHR